MTTSARDPRAEGLGLAKAPSGIVGLDEITGGGLPRGRPTLVCGSAGCGGAAYLCRYVIRPLLRS